MNEENPTLDVIKSKTEEIGSMYSEFSKKMEESQKIQDGLLEQNKVELAKAMSELELQKQEAVKAQEAIKALQADRLRDSRPVETQKAEFNQKFQEFLKSGEREFNLYHGKLDVQKTLQTDKNPNGGYVVSPDLTGRFINQIFLTSPVRPYAFVGTTNSDRVVLVEDVDQAAAERGSQLGTVSETDTPDLGLKTIYTKKYIAYPKMSEESLEDPYLDLESWLTQKVGNRIARLENYDFIWGNGTNAPEGILGSTTKSASSAVSDTYKSGTLYYLLSGTADDFDVDSLRKLYFRVKAEYRQAGRYYMNSGSLEHLFLQKDGTSNYLVQTNSQDGPTFRFFGKEIVTWEDLPDKDDSTNKYPVLFGDMNRAYSIYDRRGISIIRDNITSPGAVKLYVSKRTAGGITNYEAIKALKSNNS